jgi:putative Mg2+ transporter-C (MgtC) family protein
LIALDPQTAAIRILLALFFGAVVGVEREWRHKNAGIKTNTLVAIGAAAFAMMSNTFGPNNHNPAQLAAAVVSGIGFIGAGVIIHRGANVQGVTTAATLWASASMGVAAGLGYYVVAALAFSGIIVVQFGLRWAINAVERRVPPRREIELWVECSEAALDEVNAAWDEFLSRGEVFSMNHTTARTIDGIVWRAIFVAAAPRVLDLTTLEARIVRAAGVKKVEAKQTAPLEERLG